MEHYGIIGSPISHSLSPRLHALIYDQLGIVARYSPFEVAPAAIPGVIPALRTLGLRGINVTSPHKAAILRQVDEVSPTALAVDAVNTVYLRPDGTTLGDNTDCHGFAASLLHAGVDIPASRFVLCGQGGAGRAIVRALEENRAAEILTVSTRPGAGITYDTLRTLGPRDVIVNCTSLGMHPHETESPVDAATLRQFRVAVDLIYNPPETVFLQSARREGLQTMNGLWMLIFQGLRSFEIWTGRDTSAVDADLIYRTLSADIPG